MTNFDTMTLGEIVSKNYRTAEVFDRFNLDFCCNGNRKLSDACRQAGIDLTVVTEALNTLQNNTEDNVNFNDWPLDALVDHIQNRHHAYVEEKTPVIRQYLERICNVHGNRHPELLRIREIFNEIGGELAVHLKKEELMVFPYIKKMVKAKGEGAEVKPPVFGTINSPVKHLMADHADEGEKMETIGRLSNKFEAPDDACNTYRVAYQLLSEFRTDLHRHIHLENNILFPKAIALEEQSMSSALRSVKGGQ